MISRHQLIDQIKQKKSFLCVGLDPDFEKIPAFLKEHPWTRYWSCSTRTHHRCDP